MYRVEIRLWPLEGNNHSFIFFFTIKLVSKVISFSSRTQCYFPTCIVKIELNPTLYFIKFYNDITFIKCVSYYN